MADNILNQILAIYEQPEQSILTWRLQDRERFFNLIPQLLDYELEDEKDNFTYELNYAVNFLDNNLKGFSPANILNIDIYDKDTGNHQVQIRVPIPDINDIIMYKNTHYILPLELANESIFIADMHARTTVFSVIKDYIRHYTQNKPSIILYGALEFNKYDDIGIYTSENKIEDGYQVTIQGQDPFYITVTGNLPYHETLRKYLKEHKDNQPIQLPELKFKPPFTMYNRLKNFIPYENDTSYLPKLIAFTLHLYHKYKHTPLSSLEFRYVSLYSYLLDYISYAIKNLRNRLNSQKTVVYQNILQQVVMKRLNYMQYYNPFTEIRHKTRATIPYQVSEQAINLDPTQKYNICPFDTPDKDNTGKVVSLTPTVKIDEYGRFGCNVFKKLLQKEGK